MKRHETDLLSLVFGVNDLFDSGALGGDLFFHPFHHGHDGRVLFAKPLHELDQERVWQLFLFSESLAHERHDVCRLQ